MPSWRHSYRDKVDPDAVRSVASQIVEELGPEDPVWVAAALHGQIGERVTYDHSVDAGFNRPPAETYRDGGNCVDLAILLCSLFRAVGLRCRLVGIDGDGAEHMTSVVSFPSAPRAVTDSLTGYYSEQGRLRERTYTWLEGEYFIADYASRYLGDIAPLEAYTDSNGRFTIKETIDI